MAALLLVGVLSLAACGVGVRSDRATVGGGPEQATAVAVARLRATAVAAATANPSTGAGDTTCSCSETD